jgi:acyl-CoA dehydrogenase
MQLHAAALSVYHAANIYDKLQREPGSVSFEAVGAAANSARYNACQRAILSMGGMGFAAEFDVERYFRESWVPRLAPISREMIMNYISERVLHLPKSY